MGLTVAPYTLKDDNGEYSMPTQSGRLALDSSILALLGTTKIYIALLTQTGSSAPVATVLKNSLGGTVVWTRNGAGDYTGTLAGAFTANKTGFLMSPQTANAPDMKTFQIYRVDNNSISLSTLRPDGGGSEDDLISDNMIFILVFP